jgi:hypothetical protein
MITIKREWIWNICAHQLEYLNPFIYIIQIPWVAHLVDYDSHNDAIEQLTGHINSWLINSNKCTRLIIFWKHKPSIRDKENCPCNIDVNVSMPHVNLTTSYIWRNLIGALIWKNWEFTNSKGKNNGHSNRKNWKAHVPNIW